MCSKGFIFKSQGPQDSYFLKICRNLPYTLKNNYQQSKLKIKIWLKFFFCFPKLGKKVFDLNNRNNNWVSLLFLALKKLNNTFPTVAGL